MARIPQTRSRLLRAGLLSASILSFIPVFNLVRQAAVESAGASTASPTPEARPPATTGRALPYQEPYQPSPSQAAPSQPAPSARQPASSGSSSQSRAAPSHTRTHAS